MIHLFRSNMASIPMIEDAPYDKDIVAFWDVLTNWARISRFMKKIRHPQENPESSNQSIVLNTLYYGPA